MRFSLARFIAPLSCVLLLVPVLASARVSDSNTGLSVTGRAAGLSTACSGSASDCIATMLGRIFNVVFGFLGIVLLGYVIYGGFVWMTADGSKDVDKAQGIIRNAVIGVIIIASSFAVSSFVIEQVGQIAGVTGGGAGTESADGTGAGGRLDALMDGATRPCCYANPRPMESCVADCQRTPTAFGITGPASESACILPCGSRVCTGGTPSDPRPVAGQSQCTAGAPTGLGAGGGSAGSTLTACQNFIRNVRVPLEPCASCINGCQRATICNDNPYNNVAGRPSSAATTAHLDAQTETCRTMTCTAVCSR